VLATKTELSKNKELTDFLIRQSALFFLPVISSRFSSGPVRRRVRCVRVLSGSPGRYNAIRCIPLWKSLLPLVYAEEDKALRRFYGDMTITQMIEQKMRRNRNQSRGARG
ncbi:MAG: hypothetical protein IJK34_06705, partial [Clostridia bacterium]|nr:hypothetical protein [Clostridia bacterium]